MKGVLGDLPAIANDAQCAVPSRSKRHAAIDCPPEGGRPATVRARAMKAGFVLALIVPVAN